MSNTEKTQEIAASKAGLDVKTARKYLRARRLPSEMKAERHWRTRKDWFEEVWPRIREQLSTNPGLEVKTIFAALQREYPERFADGQLRTLQRKVKHWRATEGPAQEVYFVQEHRAGELCESDFTHLTELGISIGGEEFPHLLYHFVLTYSNWETGTVCYSESFASLSEGLQQALWELGGAPTMHRTDRMTAAINNLTELADFQRSYQALMRHYGMEGRKIQTGRPNENGDVEQGHYRFKRALEQALLLRGSRDFPSLGEYELFLKRLFEQLNSGRKERFLEELEVLRALPERRFDSAKRVRVRVSSGSLINVERNSYSVNSRLIGEIVEARVFVNHLEVWYGGQKLEQLPRLRGRTNYRVDYRHIIDWLVRKPGAFANYRYREHLFPTVQFRKVYDLLKEVTPRRCDRRYLEILHMAAKQGEARIDDALRLLLQSTAGRQAIINKEALEEFLDRCEQAPDITDVHKAMTQRGGGAIVQTGSMWALQAIGVTPSSAYSVANAGVHQMVKNLAIELAPAKIRINAVAPAVVETPVYGTFLSADQVDAVLAGFNSFHPLGRIGQPVDVVGAMLFLASDAASWITGTVLPVDGGVMAGRSSD